MSLPCARYNPRARVSAIACRARDGDAALVASVPDGGWFNGVPRQDLFEVVPRHGGLFEKLPGTLQRLHVRIPEPAVRPAQDERADVHFGDAKRRSIARFRLG